VDRIDPDHDADIRIGSEAPKQRLPNLRFGITEPWVTNEQTATSDRSWQIIALKGAYCQNQMLDFLLLNAAFCVVTYAADLNRKPSGSKPVFT
jgi:hypothetical protein